MAMLSQENYRDILIDKRSNGVVVATFNRPERRNAIGGWLKHEITTLPRDADGDPEVKVLVITGAGRSFSAGGDFSGKTPDQGPRYLNRMQRARLTVDNLLDCEKPVITAVQGHAFGLGATLALLGDVVIAARSAVFADTHVRMGMSAGDGGQVLWPLLMGPSRAKYFLMTGDELGAEEAERLGLVTFVVDDDQLMDRALALADRLAAGPIRAISASKVGVNKLLKFASNLVLPTSLAMEEVLLGSEDHQEAVAAFREKREPRFTGR